MKKLVLLLLVSTFIISCNISKKPSKKIDVIAEKAQINTVLNSWHLNAAETNFDAYFGAMTNESVFVGTDAAEVWSFQEFKDFSKPYFDKGSAWNFTAVDRNIYLNSDGEIAWFDEVLDTWMGICRGSGVLKKVENTWKIEHYVLSLTIPNDNIKQVKNINKAKDSLFLERFK
jgi:hypothetical protein